MKIKHTYICALNTLIYVCFYFIAISVAFFHLYTCDFFS
nr:MAG TPA: hypothetical protein [Caudoviricetes sp.]